MIEIKTTIQKVVTRRRNNTATIVSSVAGACWLAFIAYLNRLIYGIVTSLAYHNGRKSLIQTETNRK